jgi:hypothetical protein
MQFQDVNMKDFEGRAPALYKRLTRMSQTQLMRTYFNNKFCTVDGEYHVDMCIEKQTRYLGLVKPTDGYYYNDDGLHNVKYQASLPTPAQIEKELAKLSAFGIVEALDLSVCLIMYKTNVGGSLDLFKARCGKGTPRSNMNSNGYQQLKNNRSTRSADLYKKLRRTNPSIVRLMEFSYRSDIVLYNIAVNRFIREVRVMSKQTGIHFDVPPSLLATARKLPAKVTDTRRS